MRKLIAILTALLPVGAVQADESAFLPVAVRDMFLDSATFLQESEDFQMTQTHLDLLRQIRLSWDGTENGAPRFDPAQPFVNGAPLQVMQVSFGVDNPAAQLQKYGELLNALWLFQEHAELEPGTYELHNLSAADIEKYMTGYAGLSPAAMGLTPNGKVIVTQDSIKVAKAAYWEWPDEDLSEELLDNDEWPGPVIDPKRPYGEMSYFQLDLHRLLGWPVVHRDADGYIELSEDQNKQGQALHFQLLATLQVFLEQASYHGPMDGR